MRLRMSNALRFWRWCQVLVFISVKSESLNRDVELGIKGSITYYLILYIFMFSTATFNIHSRYQITIHLMTPDYGLPIDLVLDDRYLNAIRLSITEFLFRVVPSTTRKYGYIHLHLLTNGIEPTSTHVLLFELTALAENAIRNHFFSDFL